MTSDVRRWAAAITLAGLVAAAVALPAPAFAKDPKPGKKLCEVSDEALGELSGLVATDNGYAAIGDGSDGNVTTVDVIALDDNCASTGQNISGQVEPSDPEDLAVDGKGNYWVADTGDNDGARPSIALHKVTPDAQVSTYRFTYPDNAVDCEALLMQRDGTPIFATKELGVSNLYAPEGELDPNGAEAPLKKVGSVKIKATKTKGGPEEINGIPLGDAPSRFVTGGAVSPDGKKAVLRTYTDAYEWKVEGSDVAKSIKDGKPAITPLPEEPQGEAITYTTDGKKFVTGSEIGSGTAPALWSYTPAKAASGSDKKKDDEAAPEKSFLDTIIDTLGPNGILWAVAAVGVIGLIMVIIGGRVIWRARRNKANAHSLRESLDKDQQDGYERPRYRDQDDGFGGGKLFEPVSGHRQDGYQDDYYDEPRSGSVYGGHDDPRSGNVYGGHDDPRSGNVYGGGRPGRDRRDDEPNSGTVYGGRY
ncbi:hypothetical protein [Stackebrandtia nassauensis]|uniref:hypothetical protein n=1 Tax=Stackebrandtia nassauensis TaxID=283811 RepID=UPI0001A39702|nr:hypothetical protein [Stackebrandtia nassauensis]